MTAVVAHPAAAALPAVNLYTTQAFLDAIAAVYFEGRRCEVRDHVIDGLVFRLLVIDGRPLLSPQTFLDMHEPLGAADATGPAAARALRSATPRPRLPRLAGVGQAAVPICSFRQRTDAGEAMGAPTIFWRDFASWDDYLQLLRSRKVLSEDQRRGRRLQQIAGPLSFQLDDHADDVLPTCCAWKSARDLSLGRSDLFAQPANRRFFVELRARGLLRASTLRADGKLMAIWLGAVYERRWTGWVFTFNPEPELGRCSPGRQLLYPMLEASHRAGHAEFDFSIGMEPYKLNFATHVRPIGRIGPPPASELAAAQLRRWLRHNPWCHDKAKALRHWLSQAPLAHPFR